MPPNEAVSRAIADLSSSRRAVAAVWLAIAGLAYLVATAALAMRDQLWNDELYTYYFAHLDGFRDVWDQLSTGVEQTPPLYYLIARGTLGAFGDSNLVLRLPGLLGVLAACACLYAFVARRSSPTYGLIAALIVLSSQAVFYAHEARPYGAVLGFAAAGLLCWQLRGEGGGTYAVVGMTLSLGLAVACHYYAVLLLVPLALGEGVRSAIRRRIDGLVLAGFAIALVPLLVAAPLIQGARTYSGAFWADFGWRSVLELNGWLFETAVPSGLATRLELSLAMWLLVGIALHALLSAPVRSSGDARDGGHSSWLRRNRGLLVVAAAVLVGTLALRLLAGREELSSRRLALLVGATFVVIAYAALRGRTETADRQGDSTRLTAPEAAAAFGFLLLPLFAVATAKLVTGAYTERYVLPATIGIAVLLPLALHRLDGGRRLTGVGAAVALLLVVGYVYWDQATEIRQENRARTALIASLERATAGNGQPIVIADPHYFFELSHYAPPALARRLLHLYSREASLRYTGSYSTEEGLVVLSGFAPLDVRNFDQYVASGRPFLLLLRPERVTWVVPALEAAGRELRPYPDPGELSLYEVT